MKIEHVAVLVLLSLVAVSLSAKLANSGYPTSAMNAQRNWKSSLPLTCPDVAKGKTTVLQLLRTWIGQTDGLTFSFNRELTIDERGFMYVIGPFPEEPRMVRLHVNGTFFPSPAYTPIFSDSVPTHVQGGEIYVGGSISSERVNVNTMTRVAFFEDVVGGETHSSYLPYGANLMVKTNQGASVDSDAFTYFSILSNAETTGQQINVGSPQYNAMIYNNSQGVESIIAVGDTYEVGWMVGSTAWAPYVLDRAIVGAFITGDDLILLGDVSGANDKGAIYRINAANGQIRNMHNFTTFQSLPMDIINPEKALYQNGKSLHLIVSGESSNYYVDLINGGTYLVSDAGYISNAHPIISSDNIVLLPIVTFGGNFEFHGFDWDTQARKLHGRIPMTYSGEDAGPPVITENCNVHINIGDNVYTLAPMPLQDIVPIFECVDADGYGHFSFNNLEEEQVWIPYIVDRNNLNATDLPVYDEFPPGRGPTFPLSRRILVGTSGVITWLLEDYTLSVTLGPTLSCPTTLNLIISLSSESPFPTGFQEVVRTSFVQVTGISGSRVTIVNKKRAATQIETLETELAISPDASNTEPSPQDVVQSFVSEQVQQQFLATVTNATDAPQDINVGLSGKSVSTEIEGVLPPPVAAPVAVTQPQAAPTSVPIAGPVSSTSVLQVSCIFSFVLLFASLF